MSQESTPLYDRIGGKGALDAAVELFYTKVLSDDRIKQFFDTVDMDIQRGKQKAFLAFAFGAPVKYSGKDMRAAHAELELTEKHFGAVAENLQNTLEEMGVPSELIAEVMAIAASTHDDVLNLPPRSIAA